MTTEPTTRVVPAGWYQDPADDAKVRWWNGITWTEHVEAKPVGQGAAVAGALAIEGGAQRAAEAQQLERQFSIASDDSEILSRRAAMALDARGPSTGTIPIVGLAAPRHPVRTGTMSVWLLAFTPLFAAVLAGVAGYVYFYVTPTPLVAAVAVVLYLLGFLWAVGDSRTLQGRGIDGAPSPLWALALPLLGPLLYLIRRRSSTSTSTPVFVFAALLIVAVGAPLALGLTGNATSVTKALEVQLAVRADLVGSGAAAGVTCPPIVESTDAGTVFTCDATLHSGDVARVWVSFDTDGGQFSWALANR